MDRRKKKTPPAPDRRSQNQNYLIPSLSAFAARESVIISITARLKADKEEIPKTENRYNQNTASHEEADLCRIQRCSQSTESITREFWFHKRESHSIPRICEDAFHWNCRTLKLNEGEKNICVLSILSEILFSVFLFYDLHKSKYFIKGFCERSPGPSTFQSQNKTKYYLKSLEVWTNQTSNEIRRVDNLLKSEIK